MPTTAERMTITMPAEMAEVLRQTVAGGEYASTSKVVREALRDWTRARDTERRELDEMRAAIRAGYPGRGRLRRAARPLRRQGLNVLRLVVLPAAKVDLNLNRRLHRRR